MLTTLKRHPVILFRFPRLSNSVIGVLRVQIATRNTFALVCSKRAAVGQSIRQSVADNAGLVRGAHPFYLLALVLERRFEHWSEPFIAVWRRVVELETATSMTHPGWRTHDVDPAQVRFLASTDNLLRSLHSTHVELCHSRTVMSLGIKFGDFCVDKLDELEARREARGLRRLSSRETSGLKDLFRDTVERCESTEERFSELSDRLAGQMNVVRTKFSPLPRPASRASNKETFFFGATYTCERSLTTYTHHVAHRERLCDF